MKIVKNLKVTAAAAVLVLVAAACGAGELSGGGSADSAISSRGKISISMETKGLCVRGTERECAEFSYGGHDQLVKGEFKDSGKNAAWPYGVSMQFEGSYGTYPKDLALSNADTDCPTTGLTCWAGVVGYRSADERHYPNTPTADCVNYSRGESLHSQLVDGAARANSDPVVASALEEGVSRLQARLRDDSNHSDRRKSVTGLAFVLIVDTNRNGEIDSGEGSRGEKDQFMLQSLCGPYSNQPGLTEVDEPFSYATCALTGGTIVGTTPFYIARECPSTLRSGNLRIKMLPPTTTTTTTLPPN